MSRRGGSEVCRKLMFEDTRIAAYVGLGVASGMWIEQHAIGRPVDLSRRRSVIVLQHATEPLSTRYGPFVVRLLRERHDEPVAQALVIAFVMIMVRELTHRSSERRLPNEDDPVQT